MPGGDGRGPLGSGPRSGRRGGELFFGAGAGRGKGAGNRPGSGPGGICVCSSCNTQVAHHRGVPCSSVKCPNCGKQMVKG
jgi:hypothetical protein